MVTYLAAWLQGEADRSARFEQGRQLLQHEIDHLNGKVFVQYLSNLKLNHIKNKIKTPQREAQQ
mgnify:CR=1 FL=1